MTDKADPRFVPSRFAISSAVGDETVILQTSKGAYFGLDPVATRVWALLNEGVPSSAIAARLAAEYDAPPERIEEDVRAFLAELAANGIVDDAGSQAG